MMCVPQKVRGRFVDIALSFKPNDVERLLCDAITHHKLILILFFCRLSSSDLSRITRFHKIFIRETL
jgi:hypothetical protein